MFQRILLPLDLSDKHGRALEMAAGLCGREEGRILLLHVIEMIPGLSFEEERPFYQRLELTAQNHLKRIGQQLDEKRVRWTMEVRLGHRVQAIAEYARETGCDLIVLSSPQVDPANPHTGWGSLSYRVGLVSPCPVLLVR